MSWPKLSETLGPREIGVCQVCGFQDVEGGDMRPQAWREFDDHDEPTKTIVFLCRDCSGQLIEDHPRLYELLQLNEPRPGSMPCCARCIFVDQSHFSCRHPNLKDNGGPGLLLRFDKPSFMFVDGRTKGGKRFGHGGPVYSRNPVVCEAREIS